MTVTRRYPFGPLAKAMGLSPNQAAKALRLGGYSQKEYRSIGVSEKVADRLAVRAGLHPAEVWPEWLADHADDLEAARRRHKAEWARQNYRRPEVRERRKASANAYYADYGDRLRRLMRERYAANVEGERAKQRARYWAKKARDDEDDDDEAAS